MPTDRFIAGYFLVYLALIIISVIGFYLLKPFDKNKCVQGDCNNGYGIYVYNSGMKYEGEWKNGKRHGKGILVYPDGTRYEGEWKNNRMDGFGIKTSPIFRAYKYTGQWKGGNKHGIGIQYFSPYEWYRGGWKKGMRDGYGEFKVIKKNGTIRYEKGLWKNHFLIRKVD
jgi:hypothetical protein